MRGSPSLLSRLQRIIERSYDWNTGIDEIGAFVVGDEGYQELYGAQALQEQVFSERFGARTLVTWRGGEVRARIYYPDHLVTHLERFNPLQGLDEENFLPFSVLVEELDHLLMLAWCCRVGRPVRLIELEFHANVTQYLVLSLFLSRHRGETCLSPEQRRWIRRHLFNRPGEGLPAPLNERYSTAAQLALRYLDSLEELPVASRGPFLRRFTREPWAEQWARLAR